MLNPHSELVNKVLLKIGSLDFVRVWKNNTGTAIAMDGNRIIKYGLPGSADITGILLNKSGLGIRIEIEIKTGRAILNKKQKNFKKMILGLGGLYLLCRHEDEAFDFVMQVRSSNEV